MKYLFSILLFAFLLNGCSGGGGDEKQTPVKYSLSGSIAVNVATVIDGDTKESSNPLIPNNGEDLTKTQAIPNPTTVSGFLGGLDTNDDIEDFYKVDLLAGQTITLIIADPDAQDFDLYLYDSDTNYVNDSSGTGKIDQLTIPADGTYYVNAYGFSVEEYGDTGGLYTLVVGGGSIAANSYADHKMHLSTTHAFVDGELLFKYKEPLAKRLSSQNLSPQMTIGNINIATLQYGAGGINRMTLKKSPDVNRAKALSGGGPFMRNLPDTLKAVKMLRRQSNIAFAEPNYLGSAQAVPNDEYYPYQWHYPQIALPQAWDLTTGSSDVIVAVIDTGVVLSHPDLSGQLVAGYDFISGLENALDGDGIDSNPDDPGDQNQAGTSSFHGTHVAGTVAAKSNNGIGVAGVAWQTKIMPVRVLGKLGCYPYDVAQAIRYAAGLSNDSGTLPAKKADIINMSLGGSGYSQVLQEAISAARSAGVIVIAAAGNANDNADNDWPAGLDGVVNVSAVAYNGEKAPYSNFGSTVDVAAPGGNTNEDNNGDGYPDGVLSTLAKDDGTKFYNFYDGTSMAAPHMAGVAALMKAVYPALTPSDLDLLLAGNHPRTTRTITIDRGDAGKDQLYGHGLINAFNAVEAANVLSGAPAPTEPLLSVLPESINLSSIANSATLTLHNIGGGELNVTGISTAQTWLTVTAQNIQAGTYNVTADRTGMQAGSYHADIEIRSNGGDINAPVLMAVTAAGTGGDSGTVYIVLLDPDTFDTVAGDTTSKANNYQFTLSGIAAGEYYLVAGTDLNADGFISDSGENFGAYPHLATPEMITLQGDMNGLRFNIGPLIFLPAATAAHTSTEIGKEITKEVER